MRSSNEITFRALLLALIITLLVTAGLASAQSDTPAPQTVTIAGTLQSALGCDDDWQPACEATMLEYSPANDLWLATWELPAGEYAYKAALNGAWDENYGQDAEAGGADIPLIVEADRPVTFWYDHKSHWVSDDVNSILANVPGDYQDEIGCPGDWAPDCLRSLLQDPDGDGVYTFSTFLVPPGEWEAKVAYNQSWDRNYGLEGESNGPNIPFSVPVEGHEVTVTYDAETHAIDISVSDEPVATAEEIGAALAGAVAGDLGTAKAHWVARDTIAWNVQPKVASYRFHYSPDASLRIEDGRVVGGETLNLRVDRAGLSDEVLANFPHLEGFTAFKLREEDLDSVPDILKGQFAVSVSGTGGRIEDATGLQIPGVLDDLYTYAGELGVIYDGDTPTLKLWAPTAQKVTLHLYDRPAPDAEDDTHPMELDPATGVWSITGEPDWTYKFYLYEVTVFAPSTGTIERNLVTDPYSVSLSTNSTHSQIVDVYGDVALSPPGWSALSKPRLDAPEDIVLYELHLRDFSAIDPLVPPSFQGTYMAFTIPDSYGMQHLRDLSLAGLTHVHLLPVFDIATINEYAAERTEPDMAALASYPPDSEEQQAAIEANKDQDAFNWGYDPFHYMAPEGSYATNPNGPTRILQFRRMVQGLNETAGLRVVMDVVYNHTNASGQHLRAVLDKIVPGYYHRLNALGQVETSTCCANTATEHAMMEKLMIDATLLWAKAYKVDGFRFDLMGHHMVEEMARLRAALDGLTVEADGVDGTKIYIYGEGWDFGEVANNARGVNATQLNVGGLGIGTFNDRIRDAARGGNPFGGRQEQGFVTGLYTHPNETTPGTEDEQRARLLHFADQIRVGLAGNLRDYQLESATGETVTGAEVDYNGSPTGYTLDPQEHIAYVSAHDNETLFDKIQYAAPADLSVEERVRMQNLAVDVVAFSQGVPFFHAGSDMLRSKSFDRDSYDSGGWFNRLDFAYEINNFGAGLPPASKNQDMWPVMQPLLADPDIVPGREHIAQTVVHTQEMIKIRKSSPLFRLQTAEQIQARVTFLNTGPDQLPGVIVMHLSDMEDDDLDPDYQAIVVIFNASAEEVEFSAEALADAAFALHPIQRVSADPVVQGAVFESASGTFSVPARTTAVFVLPQE